MVFRSAVCLLVIGSLAALSTAASAQVTLTDWMGRSAEFEERSVGSGGVNIVYHVAGEGPLVVFVHSIVTS